MKKISPLEFSNNVQTRMRKIDEGSNRIQRRIKKGRRDIRIDIYAGCTKEY